MFLSETIVRAILADRTRDIERAVRDHRLLADAADEPATRTTTEPTGPSGAQRAARERSAGQPA